MSYASGKMQKNSRKLVDYVFFPYFCRKLQKRYEQKEDIYRTLCPCGGISSTSQVVERTLGVDARFLGSCPHAEYACGVYGIAGYEGKGRGYYVVG